ncbi:MAG: hypothetical protein ACXV3A_06850 [Kineosporiaceae bacterium]
MPTPAWRRLPAIAVTALALVTSATLSATTASASSRSERPSSSAAALADWKLITMNTLLSDTTKAPQEAFLYTAFVDAAVYDAVVGVDGRYEPYLLTTRAPRHTSDVAAAVTAAHEVLRTYVPAASATLDDDYAASLAAVPDGPAKTRGVAYGLTAARTLVAARVGDGRNAPIAFTQPPSPGVWRPTPPANLPMAVPWMGFVRPLMVRSGSQFGEPGPPPALTSRRYTREFQETKAYGSATSTVRTADQTATAMFFSGSVYVQYTTALLDEVSHRKPDLVDAARMFAGVDMTIADAAI